MNFGKRLQNLGLATSLLALAACGGSKTSPPPAKAAGMAYVDPAGSGWRLVRNPASTDTHLVLDLMAPAATTGLGAGLVLSLDAGKAQWSKVAAGDADFAHNLAFDLGADAATRLSRGVLKGADLQVGVFQKGLANPVAYGGALLSVAIDFKGAGTLDPGTAIALSVGRAQHLAAGGVQVDLSPLLAIGSLTAK